MNRKDILVATGIAIVIAAGSYGLYMFGMHRGMADDVITVCWGEFGRTPRVNASAGGGRDHWAPCMSAMVAGGGLKMGQAVGASNARGEVPRDRSCTPSQLLATFYRAMGIDSSMTFPNQNGRPMYVLDDREVVADLI